MAEPTLNPHVGTRETGGDLHRIPLTHYWVQIPHPRTGLSTRDRLVFTWDRKVIGYLKQSTAGLGLMKYQVYPCQNWRTLIDSASNGETRPIGWAHTMGQGAGILDEHWQRRGDW